MSPRRLAIAREAGVPVLARGGGTSQCGQTVNRALVIDCSKHLRARARASIRGARTALVEPGIVLGQLNAALRQHGLFFPVDPSTHARCTIGGMAGEQFLRLEIDPLRADGRQRHARSTPSSPTARATASADLPDNLGADMPPRHRRSHPAPARARRGGGGGDRGALPAPAPPRRRLQHRRADARRRAPPAATTSRGCWSARKAPSPSPPRSNSRCSRSSRARCSASASSRRSARRWRRRGIS